MAKNLFLILSVLFISQMQMKAQTLSFGPMVGLNYSTIRGFDPAEYKPGFAAGGFLNYSINENTGIGAKLLYSQLGANHEGSDNYARFNYIQLPISFVYFFGALGDSFRPKLFIGPYLGFLLNAKDHNGNELLLANGESPYKSIDIGGQLGAGVNVRLQDRIWLNIDALAGTSLPNILKDSNDSYKHLAFALNVGVSFPIGQ